MESLAPTMNSLIHTKESDSSNKTCAKCGWRTSMTIDWLGKSVTVPAICKCENDKEEKRKQEEKDFDRQKRLEKMKNYSLMDKGFESCTFENYKVDKENHKWYGLAKEYCEDWQEVKKEGLGFLFYGGVGVGKSYLSFCIANYLINRFVPVIAISSIGLINKVYEGYSKFGAEGEAEVVRSLNNADLLVLDDLGAEHEGKGGKEKQIIYSVIDSRIRNNKPTIITTNLSLPQLKQKLTASDGINRTYDRLIPSCTPMEFKGESKRIETARKKQDMVKELLRRSEAKNNKFN